MQILCGFQKGTTLKIGINWGFGSQRALGRRSLPGQDDRHTRWNSARLQAARMRDAVPVPCKPPVTLADHPVEPGQTENRIEGPSPPDPPRDIEINVGSRNHLAIGRQQPYVGDQFFERHLELIRHPRFVQRGNLEPAPRECPSPTVHPARAKAALPIVKDDATDRRSRFSAHIS